VDATYLNVVATWQHLYRAIDQFGQGIDVMLSPQRYDGAAQRFFARPWPPRTSRRQRW